MSERVTVEDIWKGLDRALLLAVAALLAVSWYESSRECWPQTPGLGTSRTSRKPTTSAAVRAHASVSVAESLPVSLPARRMSAVARAMAESAWEGLPSSPVADMREQNGSYDIQFALPDNLDPESVKASTSGNVLTLYVRTVGNPAATFVKQFYIPCGAARVSAVETSVSNDLVRVRILQPVGG